MWKIKLSDLIGALMLRIGDRVEKTVHSAYQCTWTGSNNANLSPK